MRDRKIREQRKSKSKQLRSSLSQHAGLTAKLAQRRRNPTALKSVVHVRSPCISPGLAQGKNIKPRQEISGKRSSKRLQNRAEEPSNKKRVLELETRNVLSSLQKEQGSKCKRLKLSEDSTDLRRKIKIKTGLQSDSLAEKMDNDYYRYNGYDRQLMERDQDYTGRFQRINSAQYRDEYRSRERARLLEHNHHGENSDRFRQEDRGHVIGQDIYNPVDRVQIPNYRHGNNREQHYETYNRPVGRHVGDRSHHGHDSQGFDSNFNLPNKDRFLMNDQFPYGRRRTESEAPLGRHNVSTFRQRQRGAAYAQGRGQSRFTAERKSSSGNTREPVRSSARSSVSSRGNVSRETGASGDHNTTGTRTTKALEKSTATATKTAVQAKHVGAGEMSTHEVTTEKPPTKPLEKGVAGIASAAGAKVSTQNIIKKQIVPKQRSPTKRKLTVTVSNQVRTVVPTTGLATEHGTKSSPAETAANVRKSPPALTAANVTKSSPALTGANVTRSSPALNVANVTRSSPALTAANVTRSSPDLTAANLMKSSPALTAANVTKSSPALTAANVTRSSPALTAANVTKSSPALTAANVTRSSPALTAANVTKSSPTAANVTKSSPALTATNVRKSSPALTAANVRKSSPALTAANVTKSSPALTATNVTKSSPALTAANVTKSSPSVTSANVTKFPPSVTAANVRKSSPALTAANVTKFPPSVTAANVRKSSPALTATNVTKSSPSVTAANVTAPTTSSNITASQKIMNTNKTIQRSQSMGSKSISTPNIVWSKQDPMKNIPVHGSMQGFSGNHGTIFNMTSTNLKSQRTIAACETIQKSCSAMIKTASRPISSGYSIGQISQTTSAKPNITSTVSKPENHDNSIIAPQNSDKIQQISVIVSTNSPKSRPVISPQSRERTVTAIPSNVGKWGLQMNPNNAHYNPLSFDTRVSSSASKQTTPTDLTKLDKSGFEIKCTRAASTVHVNPSTPAHEKYSSPLKAFAQQKSTDKVVCEKTSDILMQPKSTQAVSQIASHAKPDEKVIVQTKACEKVIVQPKASDKIIVQPKANDKIIVQTKASDKVIVQPKASDKVIVQAKTSDKAIIQTKASDKIPAQPKQSEKVTVESKTNGKASIEPKAIDNVIVQANASDKVIVQAKASDKVIVQAKASDRITVQPKQSDTVIVQTKASEKVIVQTKASEKVIVQPKASDKVIVQPKASDKVIVQTKASDKVFVQEKASDKIPVQPKQSEKVIVQTKASDKVIVQPKASDKVIVHPKQSDKVIAQPKASDKVFVQEKASDKIPVQPKQSKQVIVQTKASDKNIVQPKASDKVIVEPKANDKVFVQEKASDRITVQPKQSDKVIVQTKASDKVIVQPKQGDKVIVQPKASDTVFVQEKASDKIPVQPKQSEKVSAELKTNDKASIEPKAIDNVIVQKKASDKDIVQRNASDKVQPSDKVLYPRKPSENISAPQKTIEKSDEAPKKKSFDNILLQQRSTEKVLVKSQLGDKRMDKQKTSDNMAASPKPIDIGADQPKSSVKVLGHQKSSEKDLDKSHSSDKRVDKQNSSDNMAASPIKPIEKSNDQPKSSGNVFGHQKSSEKDFDKSHSSDKRVNKQKSSDNIATSPIKPIEKGNDQPKSSGNVFGHQKSSEKLLDKSHSSDKRVNKQKSSDNIVTSPIKPIEKGNDQPKSSGKVFTYQKSSEKLLEKSHSSDKRVDKQKSSDNIVTSPKRVEKGNDQPKSSGKVFTHQRSTEKHLDKSHSITDWINKNIVASPKGNDQPKSSVKVFAHQKSSEKNLEKFHSSDKPKRVDKQKSSDNMAASPKRVEKSNDQPKSTKRSVFEGRDGIPSDSDDSDSDDSVLDSLPSFLKTLKRASSSVSTGKTLAVDLSDHDVFESDTEARDCSKPSSSLRLNKNKFSLDTLLSERKERVVKDQRLEDMQETLKAVIKKGGFFHVQSDGEDNIGDDLLLPEHHQQLNYLSVKEKKIVEIHPGVLVFSSERYKYLFNETLSLRTCGFSPGTSYIDKCLNSLSPDGLSSFLTSHLLSMTFGKVSCPHAVLTWLFCIMSVHPSRLILDGCRQDLAEIITHQQEFQNLTVTWAPTIQTILRVFINYGASLSSLCSDKSLLGLTDDEIRVLETPLEGDTKENEPPVLHIPQLDNRRMNRENFRQVLQMIEMSLRGRPGYSKEQLLTLAIILCNSALDKSLVNLMLHHEFQVCLASLLQLYTDNEWHEQAASLCQLLYRLTSHHHNCVYVVELFPPTPRGHYVQRRLSYLILCDILQIEQHCKDLHQLKVQYLVSMIGKMRELIHTDLYQLASVVNLMDKCVGNERLPLSEKGDLMALTDSVRNLTGQIRDNISMLDRTKVKDMMVRLTSTWTLRMHSMNSKQLTLFTCKKSTSPGKMVVETVASQETESESESTDEDEPSAKRTARRNVVSKSVESFHSEESMDTIIQETELSNQELSSVLKSDNTPDKESDRNKSIDDEDEDDDDDHDDDDLPELGTKT